MYRVIVSLCLLVNLGFSESPAASLQQLMEGNQRYVDNRPLHPDISSERREELVEKQQPFAIIVGCSDSRVAPEIIFDQGLGDLFIVRVAGNVVGPVELESIEYSADNLGTSLLIVLGHESCGAVTAVMKGQTKDIKDVADLIKPAIKGAPNLEAAIKANVRWVVAGLKKNPVLKRLLLQKKMDCIGAYYHLDTGRVEILVEKTLSD